MSKRVLWVIEFFIDGKWISSGWAAMAREEARGSARYLAIDGDVVRVVKYTPAD